MINDNIIDIDIMKFAQELFEKSLKYSGFICSSFPKGNEYIYTRFHDRIEFKLDDEPVRQYFYIYPREFKIDINGGEYELDIRDPDLSLKLNKIIMNAKNQITKNRELIALLKHKDSPWK